MHLARLLNFLVVSCLARCFRVHLFTAHSILRCGLGYWVTDWIWNLVSFDINVKGGLTNCECCSSSPGVVVANTLSVGASLSVWVAAGILAWTGARYGP